MDRRIPRVAVYTAPQRLGSSLPEAVLSAPGEAFLAGLRLHPRDWAGLTMLGNVYYAKGALRLARSLQEQSLAIHESAYALANLGGVLGKEGCLASANTCSPCDICSPIRTTRTATSPAPSSHPNYLQILARSLQARSSRQAGWTRDSDSSTAIRPHPARLPPHRCA
jgi:hypothetical protein